VSRWRTPWAWKESNDPDKDAKLDRIEEVTSRFPDRCFAFDQFGPLSIRDPPPQRGRPLPGGPEVDPSGPPRRRPRLRDHGQSVSEQDPDDSGLGKKNKVEVCLTPTSASWANPIEAQFGPLRTFVMGNSSHANHTVLARELQAYLRWRNANARHADVPAAQHRERGKVRSERQQR
jgi:hypothetical protein